MTNKGMTRFIRLLRPEDSSAHADRFFGAVTVRKTKNAHVAVSTKAVFWTGVSILAGLAIGQLH